jgi:hypothetical protein
MRIGFGYAAAALLAGGCLGLVVGGPAWAVSIIVWATGAVALTAALMVLAGTMRPFRIAMDDNGLDIRAEGQVFAGPWHQVRAISVEHTMPTGTPPTSREVLVLWVDDTVPMRHQPTFPPTGTGPKGHVLVDLEHLQETSDQVTSMLRRYAGDRFRSLATT